jgi:diaminohydroxyphosphoribosylaminopyrimidine deaminase/5-amino-6-(5-phosphoribosylamino)uracil reductase
MGRALELAREGLYNTRPNPRVGCVVVADGEIVAEGWTAPAGGLHAEARALRRAGERARGATLYCTLEPCAHFGRTPPCADAIVGAGAARVVVATGDPFERVAGEGFARLRAAGIEVDTGLREREARALNVGFHARLERGRPWLRLKLAASLDGRTAMASGESRWITGPDARRDVHRLRARSCAVITGVGTVLADDPQLTARREELEGLSDFDLDFLERKPALRVVLDAALRTPPDARVLADGGALLVCAEDTPAAARARYGESARVETLPTAAGRVDLEALLERLAALECNEVLLECGPTLAGEALARGLVDEFWYYQAPVLMGDRARPLATLALDTMAERLRFRLDDVSRLGEDLRMILVPAAPTEAP